MRLLQAGLWGLAVLLPVNQAMAAEMKAYLVSEAQVTDEAKFREYAVQVPATLKPFGGVFVAVGGKADPIAGPSTGRIAIIEFPSHAQAKAWHDSPKYQRILVLRDASSTSRAYVVDGAGP